MISLFLGEEAAKDPQGIGNWWTEFQKVNRPRKIEMLQSLRDSGKGL